MPQRKSRVTKLTAKELLVLFEQEGALLTGHFHLSSGLHSEKYLQCAIILQRPDLSERIGAAIAAKFSRSKIDCVVGPAIGGIIVAHEVARALGVRAMFTERESDSMTLRRGFSIKKGERALVVEDITTTGRSVNEVIAALEALSAVVVGVGAVIDRSGGEARFSVPFKPLARLHVATFRPEACPLCRQGSPISKPGSRKG